MPTANPDQADPVLALLQPLLARLDAARAADAAPLYAALRRLRAGDPDIASDDPRLAPHLTQMRQAGLREAAAGAGVQFQNWSDLHNHLRFALVPFGRALLDLHSEAEIARPAMDAAMLATGLLAILQQAPQRFRDSGRIVLPAQWFPAGSDIAAWLLGHQRSPALDTAYGHGLARLDELLATAERGLAALHDRKLREGMAATLFLARRLQQRLRRRTPNVKPVTLTWIDRLRLRLA